MNTFARQMKPSAMKVKTKVVGLIFVSLLWILLPLSCTQKADEEEVEALAGDEFYRQIQSVKNDTSNSLQMVLNRRKLIAVTNFNSLNYYIYRGETMGYQYEMLKSFATYLDVPVEIKVEPDLSKCMDLLYEGKVDLIAMGLATTSKRKKYFDFSDPLLITRQVLVQKLPKNWQQMRTLNEIESNLLRSSLELANKAVHVRAGSVYKRKLENLSNEIGDTIYVIEDQREVDELIEAVAKGEISYTVADEYLAIANKQNYPEIDYGMPLSFDQKIAWAFRKEQTNELRDELNNWLKEFNGSAESKNIYRKYFESIRSKYMLQSDYHSSSGGRLSMYDGALREVARDIGWDWRLLASLVYQESTFKPDAESWTGAYGLMQLMPSVMQQFGIDATSSPAEQIQVGGKYILYLDRLIPETVTDTLERAKFVLAAYNTGVGHVLDARRLAEKYGKNPNIWTDNVDFFARNKSRPSFYNDPVVYYGYARGEETYTFVNDIIERYENYKNLVR